MVNGLKYDLFELLVILNLEQNNKQIISLYTINKIFEKIEQKNLLMILEKQRGLKIVNVRLTQCSGNLCEQTYFISPLLDPIQNHHILAFITTITTVPSLPNIRKSIF